MTSWYTVATWISLMKVEWHYAKSRDSQLNLHSQMIHCRTELLFGASFRLGFKSASSEPEAAE